VRDAGVRPSLAGADHYKSEATFYRGTKINGGVAAHLEASSSSGADLDLGISLISKASQFEKEC